MQRCFLFHLLLLVSFSAGAQFSDDFSDGDFTVNPSWRGDELRFTINAARQLQLSAPAVADSAYLATPFGSQTNTEWNFWIKISFSPSDNNFLKIALASSNANVHAPLQGYFIRIGENGSADGIDLYRQDGYATAKIIDGLPGRAAGSVNTLRIKVTRDSSGIWRLYSDTTGGFNYVKEGETTDSVFTAWDYFGISCKYTGSNSAKFYFDDFYAGPVRLDTVPPKIISVNVLSAFTVAVTFDEVIDKSTAVKPFRYRVDNTIYPDSISFPAADPATLLLHFEKPFKNGIPGQLCAEEVADLAGNYRSQCVSFAYYEPSSADLIINEVLFNPYDDGVDFVEVLNRSQRVVDLQKIFLTGADYKTGKWEKTCTLATASLFLYPGQYAVLTVDPAKVKKHYTSAPSSFVTLASLPPYNNDAGVVLLTDSAGNVLDKFRYTEEMHFPLLNNVEGVSLERINPYRPAEDISNWHSAAERAGYATPGQRNSQYHIPEAGEGTVSVEPEIFSPDNDGYNDKVYFHFKFTAPGWVGNAAIYDHAGRPLRYLLRNDLLGLEGMVSWDGFTEKRERAAPGIYFFFLEIFNTSGEVRRYKKTCVLAGH